MCRFRWIAVVGTGVMLTGLCLGAMAWQGPAVMGVDDATLAGITGGAGGGDPECYKADTREGGCNDRDCKKADEEGKWEKKVGTGQQEAYCKPEADWGWTKCTPNTPALCQTKYTCTDSACSSCTSCTATVNSNVHLEGDRCSGSCS